MPHTAIAKITRPRLSAVYPRTRLFRLLDEGQSRPLTWVTGPGGSGKTTLVASWIEARRLPCLWYHLDEADGDLATFFYYLGLAARKAAPRHRTPLPLLTPEYLRAVPAFTKRSFENLFSRLKPPHAIVLDNYHHLPADSPFHDMLREALSVVPDGFSVVIMSRGAPPPALAAFQTYNRINGIGWEELKFDMNETGAFLRSGRRNGLPVEVLTRIQQTTLGWAAGLTLLMERMRTDAGAPGDIDRFNPQEFFDYFATELFEKADPETQSFLLKTAFLPRISPPSAAGLTGRADAGALLAALSRNHFFTEQRSLPHPVYQYHPLFREFLQARARQTYPSGQIRDLLRKAGELLEQEGQPEDAAELYRLAGEWKNFVRTVLAIARALVSQGRSRALEAHLTSVPAEVVGGEPWLTYWLGVCRMPFDLTEGRRCFERAFALFRKRRDAAGIFLAWSGVTESIIQELGDLSQMDPWIALLGDLMKQYPRFPSPQTEAHVTSRIFMALSLRRPRHPSFDHWKEKALALLDDGGADPSLRLLTGYYLFTHFIQAGDRSMCEHALGAIRRLLAANKNVSPLAQCMGKMADAWFAWAICSYDECMALMDEGLRISKESGVHRWDFLILTMGVCASLSSGNLAASEKLLEGMAPALEQGRPLDKFYYHLMSASHCAHADDIPRALSAATTANDLAQRIGFLGAQVKSGLALAFLTRTAGKHAQARTHIAECRRIGRDVKSDLVEFFCLLSESRTDFAEHREAAGMRRLKNAMELGRKRGFALFNYTLWIAQEITSLCVKALEAGIETEFVRDLVRKRGLVPEEPPLHVENWPWPVRIITLGEFRLLVRDEPVSFSGKVQKKPLEMLKAIIAFGGREVSEERMLDALWPDAEGDAARISFKTTLHRLRQLLGNDDMIRLREGRLSLDPRICWVDVWAFEKMLENAEFGLRNAELEKKKDKSAIRNRQSVIAQHLQKALQLYRGHFLASDGEKPWTLSARERLRSKYLRAVGALGAYWLEQGAAMKKDKARSTDRGPQAAVRRAIACYERGLEVDDAAEEFYQQLMLCHQQAGSRAEAVKVFRHCSAALSAAFGIEPSEETKSIYRSIVGP